ncbi:MAG: oxidoreductase [Chitinophagaceae bacterium]|nr:oxidoreductase [Chitinophagaceae bacterium]
MRKKNKIILLIAYCLLPFASLAQTVKLLHSGNKISLRGLSVVDDKTIWVSGSSGTVGQSLDSGNTWKWMTVQGFEKTDFRDIEAFDKKTAVIMGIASPAYILKTKDGGETWKVVYENKDTTMFLDAMEFWNEQSGIVIGDPLKGKMFVARTFDGGNTWQHLPSTKLPEVAEGEACFASSGTNIRKLNKKEAVFITGGKKSRMFIRDNKIEMPIIQGTETTGANSLAVKNSKTMIVVGGDFNTKDSSTKNCIITTDGGKTFATPAIPPHGYRSCVEHIKNDKWISCGLNGVDISTDNGNIWQWISKESFHACRKLKRASCFFSGGNGRIGKLIME